jgi:hypothetical protein
MGNDLRICEQEGCGQPAVFTFRWLGDFERERAACEPHAAKAVNIAESMGFRLDLTRIAPEPDPVLDPTLVRFPAPTPEKPEPLFLGPFQENRVMVDGRWLPLLGGFKDDEGYWLVVDHRFACGPFPTEEIARQAALCAGQAMAVTAGYAHLGAESKDQPFAPLLREMK